MTKKQTESTKTFDRSKTYSLTEGIGLAKKNATAKFDETIELHVHLGVDAKKTDQQVRGTAVLPKVLGKKKVVVVIAKGDKVSEAKDAGADFFGDADIIEKISKGWLDFDVLVATPDMMKDLTKLGKVLGPKGLMPNPKSGTVTFEVGRVVKELKAGRVEFKMDDTGNLHCGIGKASFKAEDLIENAQTVLQAVAHAKPATSKGVYIASITVTSTMGPGIRVAQEA
jgi:large subunit ribosomal protein L1